MERSFLALTASLALALPVAAQDEGTPPSPGEIVNAASPAEWVSIAPEDLLVMTLAPAADGSERMVVIQLMPAPFSQGWVENIRTLARAGWYDGISVNRVQGNYVVQWGDPGYDNPEGGEVETKPLPDGLNVMEEEDYTEHVGIISVGAPENGVLEPALTFRGTPAHDNYADGLAWFAGFPFALDGGYKRVVRAPGRRNRTTGEESSGFSKAWPIHCYGMVGVGRSYSPDTGSGAELYTVIGHAPRHLDRNIALVGRIISGMEHLSSLPRGSGALGFYTDEEAYKRTPILSVRVAADLPESGQPRFEYLTTGGETFARYVEARSNRRDPFFIHPAGGVDICNIPVPIRAVESSG